MCTPNLQMIWGTTRAGKETQRPSLSLYPSVTPFLSFQALPVLAPCTGSPLSPSFMFRLIFVVKPFLSYAHSLRKAGHLPLPPCHPVAHLCQCLHTLGAGAECSSLYLASNTLPIQRAKQPVTLCFQLINKHLSDR